MGAGGNAKTPAAVIYSIQTTCASSNAVVIVLTCPGHISGHKTTKSLSEILKNISHLFISLFMYPSNKRLLHDN